MADVIIQLGYKDSAWFTANASLVLAEGQKVHLLQTGTYKLGDGVTQLSALSFLGASGSVAHNDTTGKQGGTTNEYYHLTSAQHTVVQNTSGTNTGDQDLSGLQATSAKDATGGYVGLTLFKINFKNALNTFTSFFTNSNTAARTYTFPDKDGTVAMTSDALSYQPIFSGKYRTQPYVGGVGASGGFNGLIYFMPYFTGKPHTILSISMNCTSSVAGTSIRLAIYNQTNGVPTTLIEESGTINCSTSGMKIFTFSSPIALTDEVYFFAIQSSASTVVLSYLLTANTSLILMRPNATELNSYSKTQAYGAFPNPVVTPGSSTTQPIIYAITQ